MTDHRLSRRAYRALLRLAPNHLRRTHGPAMEQLFLDLLESETARRGVAGWIAVWLGATRDLIDASIADRVAWAKRKHSPAVTNRLRSTLGPLNDVRRSIRLLRQKPGFALVAVLTLAIGLGANAAIFSVINAVLLRPLPYPDPGRVVTLWESRPQDGRPRSRVAPPTFADWRAEARAFDRLAAYSPGNSTLTGGAFPERVATVSASSDVFHLLGVPMRHGQAFPENVLPGTNDRLVVVSSGFAQRWFGDPAGAVGSSLTLDDREHTIVGVLPREFRFPDPADIWLPLTFTAEQLSDAMRGARYLNVLGRLKPDVSVEQAQADVAAVALALGEQHPNNRGWGVRLIGLHDLMVKDYRQNLILLQIAVGFVLLIACGNVVSLVLARASDRLRDRTVKRALGATRLHLLRQSLSENLTLTLLGGAAGVVLAAWTVTPLVRLAPAAIPRIDDAAVTGQVVLFCFGAAVIVALLMTAVQHLSERGWNSDTILGTGNARAAHREHHRTRSVLIVLQVALSLVLLAGAGVMLKSFVRLGEVDPGFATENVITVSLSLPKSRYQNAVQQNQAFESMTARIGRLDGIEGVGFTTNLPMTGSAWAFGFSIDGRPPTDEHLVAEFHAVTPGYFNALGISVRGRRFDDSDAPGTPAVVIINETMAARYWLDRSPLGERITVVSQGGAVSREIVGVVADVKHAGLVADPKPEVYLPMAQDTWAFGLLAIRGNRDMQALWPDIRAELAAVDPSLPLTMRPMTDIMAQWLAPLEFQMIMVGLFAAFALIMAALGIYGVIAYLV
ncbi:MAG: ABC transporter permease, partial [Gemmatimonadetes bacterium]|nr:ABC transporter permease [Gemmatimonadota bacterium]